MINKKSPKHLKPVEVEELRKPMNFGIYFVIILVVLIIAAILIAWDRFTVREIEVEGTENVSYLEVIHLSGIEYMSNIFTINLKEVEQNIEQNPVLAVTEVKRKFPDTIIITIVERAPVAVIKADDKYVVINRDLIALSIQESSSEPENPEIIGATVSSYVLGEEIVLEKELHETKLKMLLEAFESSEVTDLIETIDISYTENIKLYANAGYDIQIGNTDNLENKCSWIKKMIADLSEDEKEGGTIYITNVNTAHYIAPEDDESD